MSTANQPADEWLRSAVTVYCIQSESGRKVNRRFREFVELHDAMRKMFGPSGGYGERPLPALPPKISRNPGPQELSKRLH